MSTRSAAEPRPRTRHSKDVRRAWISVALVPVGVVAAMVVGDALASAFGYESGSGEPAPLWVAAAAGIPSLLVAVVPGAFAVWFGLRARRAGDERGQVPALVGGALGIGFVALNALSFIVTRLVGG